MKFRVAGELDPILAVIEWKAGYSWQSVAGLTQKQQPFTYMANLKSPTNMVLDSESRDFFFSEL